MQPRRSHDACAWALVLMQAAHYLQSPLASPLGGHVYESSCSPSPCDTHDLMFGCGEEEATGYGL